MVGKDLAGSNFHQHREYLETEYRGKSAVTLAQYPSYGFAAEIGTNVIVPPGWGEVGTGLSSFRH